MIYFQMFVFNSNITHFAKTFTVTRQYVFWCARKSTIKNLPKIQLDIRILILNITHCKTWSKFLQVDEIYKKL